MQLLNEKLFQFIWQHKLFDPRLIHSDEHVEIIYVGEWNHNAGPDFLSARIKIGGITLIGDIELHVQSSDWDRHHHSNDPAFDKIILHVVYAKDKEILDAKGEIIPTIELKNAISTHLLEQYEKLMNKKSPLSCGEQIHQVREIIIAQQMERSLTLRLKRKSTELLELLRESQNDWNEVFYITISRAFGNPVNADCMQSLATRIPLKYLARQKESLVQIEAMLLGVAGLLPLKIFDEYSTELVQEYEALSVKYKLQKMDTARWKFSRMRPANFPTIRITQLAHLIYKSQHLMSKILEAKTDLDALYHLLDCYSSMYWDRHYTWNQESEKVFQKTLGKNTQDSIIINAIVPLLYSYGIYTHDARYQDASFKILEQINAENNKFTRIFQDLNIPAKQAYQSQAMIELYKNGCSKKACLDCAIGYSVLKKISK
jgi:hypothetical protein